MLDVTDLHVDYGTTTAVNGIDFSVERGQSLALLGPNGAGKTSTLRAISGHAPSTGTITVDGEDLTRLTPEQIARRGVIQVPEGRHIFGSLSVRENLQMGEVARGSRTAEYDVDDIFDLFAPLQPLRDRQGFALSGGEQQMVAIGRALVAAPEVLLVDEPSLGLAPVVVDVVMRVLAEVRSAMAVVVVEQNSSAALKITTDAIVLRDGNVALTGTAEDIAADRDLLATYLGR